jgi:hypothetical protein
VLLALLLAACPPSSNTPPTRDADAAPAAGCPEMCANLDRLQCSDYASDCMQACSAGTGAFLDAKRKSCLASAGTKADARACGVVRCP